jgi:hypothetical protein
MRNVQYAALPGRAWWGKSGIKEGTASSREECEAMCSAELSCSGATFNESRHYCWTRRGDGTITTSTDDSFAIIPKQKAALIVMQGLNDRLLSLNQEIASKYKQIHPQVQRQMEEMNANQQSLKESYMQLLEQKITMEKQLQEYYTISEDYESESLFANQQNISLRVWVLITCLILIITIKQMSGANSVPISIIFWLIVISILIALTFTLSAS